MPAGTPVSARVRRNRLIAGGIVLAVVVGGAITAAALVVVLTAIDLTLALASFRLTR